MRNKGNINETEWTLWSFLEMHKIEVPVIQRDYAQGRVGNEYLRNNFLSDIKQALDGELPNGEKELKVDFVYGPEDNGVLQLLDGQQRLTTLWLLHWYIALRAGKLGEARERLKNFSYATRVTSRAFCEQLCLSKNFEPFNDDRIVQFIKDSIWFYSAWEQDPTIQSMLRMLEGTKINNKKGSDITDGLEELFVGKVRTDFEKYWGKLTEEAPIVFNHLALKDFDLYDDLYVKMNQRGKKLTSFENFKADLIRYIRGQAAEEEREGKGGWKALLDIERSMDTDWTDIFWENKSKDCSIDEIYFTFLNRFFMNYRIRELNGDEEYYKYFEKDTAIVYSSLDNYKWTIRGGEDKGIEIRLFEDLSTILNNYYIYFKGLQERGEEEKLKSIFECPWGKDVIPFEFIPTYEGDNVKVAAFNGDKKMIQRVVFYAVCKYFNEGKADEESLRQWMRFVWNLVSVRDLVDGKDRMEMKTTNYINDFEKAKEAIDIINQIDSHNTYKSLHGANIKMRYTVLYERFEEEVEKARQIEEGGIVEEVIRGAEKYSFFQGGIGFLFRGENGSWDWESFAEKLENVKKFFKKEVKDDNSLCINGEEYDKAKLLRTLISFFSPEVDGPAKWDNSSITLRGSSGNAGCGKPLYNNKAATWRYLLNNKAIYGAVHRLLMGDSLEKIKRGKGGSNQRVLWMLSQTKLLDYLITEVKYPLRYRLSSDFEAFFNSSRAIRILMDSHNEKRTLEQLLGDIKNEREKDKESDEENPPQIEEENPLQIVDIYNKYNPYEMGHFICQKNYSAKNANGGWGDAFILVPEDEGNEIKSLQAYEEWRKEHNEMIE